MSKTIVAPAPAYVYSVSHVQCDGFEEARIRLEMASKAISTFCNLLSDNGGQINIDPEGLYILLFPVEVEISSALNNLTCAMKQKQSGVQ